MSPLLRRAVQAVLYETFALLLVGPLLAALFDRPAGATFGLALLMSTIALVWNGLFNALFERWEATRAVKGRSMQRRLLHATGFEGGLTVFLVPVIAAGLDLTLLDAFLTNLGLLAFFFVYAFVFTWSFDRIFGLPASAP